MCYTVLYMITHRVKDEAYMEETEKYIPDKERIAGRQAVSEALRSGTPLESISVSKGEIHGSLLKILAMAREKGIPIKEVSPAKLDALSPGVSHQGVVAIASAHAYSSVQDILDRAKEKNEPLFVLLCDGIEDPYNLGALIRTAEAAGAHGVIIPKRRSAGLTGAVYKGSAGALNHLPVARVSNIASAIEELKKLGVWIYAADMKGDAWCQTDFSSPLGLVVGSEGDGVSRLVKEKCDFTVSLPMLGKVGSLNASVAAGILMYEVTRQRLKLKAL